MQWYVSRNLERMEEINFCVRRLLANREIAHVVLCVPEGDLAALPRDMTARRGLQKVGNEEAGRPTSEAKVSAGPLTVEVMRLPRGSRLTYAHVTRTAVSEGTVYIILNSDIVVPEAAARQIGELLCRKGRAASICLSRYESSLEAMRGADEDAKARLRPNHRGSQDLWAFRGGSHIRDLRGVDVPLGIPGCDHRIAWALNQRTETLNPSLSIRTYHVHKSNFRTYTKASKIPKPWHYISATAILARGSLLASPGRQDE